MGLSNVASLIRDRQKQLAVIDYEIDQIAEKHFEDYSPFIHLIGRWECEKSPLGLCVYDREKDPASDGCIFCKNPHERK